MIYKRLGKLICFAFYISNSYKSNFIMHNCWCLILDNWCQSFLQCFADFVINICIISYKVHILLPTAVNIDILTAFPTVLTGLVAALRWPNGRQGLTEDRAQWIHTRLMRNGTRARKGHNNTKAAPWKFYKY